jgi:hypothetical protein
VHGSKHVRIRFGRAAGQEPKDGRESLRDKVSGVRVRNSAVSFPVREPARAGRSGPGAAVGVKKARCTGSCEV